MDLLIAAATFYFMYLYLENRDSTIEFNDIEYLGCLGLLLICLILLFMF